MSRIQVHQECVLVLARQECSCAGQFLPEATPLPPNARGPGRLAWFALDTLDATGGTEPSAAPWHE